MQDKEDGYTALIWASSDGHGTIVDSLIRAGASVDIQSEGGWTALIWASRNGHGSIFDSLIRAGASVDIQDMYGNTALIWASSDGHGSIWTPFYSTTAFYIIMGSILILRAVRCHLLLELNR